MARLCFVLDELYPFTSGGIGRLAHNILQHERQRGLHELAVLVPTRRAIDPDEFRATFGADVRLHRVQVPTASLLWRQRQATRESRAVFEALRGLASAGHRFDFIEFADYLGWGAVSARRRHTLGARIVVRLHAGFGFLSSARHASWDRGERHQVALEKSAVVNADLVVTHLAPVARQLGRYYFDDDERATMMTTALPPVVWPFPAAVEPMTRRSAPDFLFLSKIQAVKNPELFVDGCVAFFDRHPDYVGRAELACHAYEPTYAAAVLARVPARWRDKIVWRAPLSREEWPTRVRGAVVVIPSVFESLSLLTYESIASSAITCVNATCAAFADGSPLIDGANCFKFAPHAGALADTLERAAFGEIQLVSRVPTPELAYWDQ